MRDALHYRNLGQVKDDDIVMASYGGAGASLLGNIVLELGYHYVNPGTERLLPDGTAQPPASMATYRARLAATYTRDSATAPPQGGPRLVKTHLWPEEFGGRRFRGVWLLIRDPRDSLYSWYRWCLDFPDHEWERAEGSFADFLSRRAYTGHPPVEGWASFHEAWLARAETSGALAVTRFEDLKSRPVETVEAGLRALGLHADPLALRRAVERSTYEAMRRHEDRVARHDRDKGHARIMRRGLVGEWKEWMTADLSRHFAGSELQRTAAGFGYDLGAAP